MQHRCVGVAPMVSLRLASMSPVPRYLAVSFQVLELVWDFDSVTVLIYPSLSQETVQEKKKQTTTPNRRNY